MKKLLLVAGVIFSLLALAHGKQVKCFVCGPNRPDNDVETCISPAVGITLHSRTADCDFCVASTDFTFAQETKRECRQGSIPIVGCKEAGGRIACFCEEDFCKPEELYVPTTTTTTTLKPPSTTTPPPAKATSTSSPPNSTETTDPGADDPEEDETDFGIHALISPLFMLFGLVVSRYVV